MELWNLGKNYIHAKVDKAKIEKVRIDARNKTLGDSLNNKLFTEKWFLHSGNSPSACASPPNTYRIQRKALFSNKKYEFGLKVLEEDKAPQSSRDSENKQWITLIQYTHLSKDSSVHKQKTNLDSLISLQCQA